VSVITDLKLHIHAPKEEGNFLFCNRAETTRRAFECIRPEGGRELDTLPRKVPTHVTITNRFHFLGYIVMTP
jgi:hypothetical protein